jgi:MFS family permease
MKHKQTNRIPLYYFFTSLFWGSLYAYMSFFTNYADEVGASPALAGLIVGCYGFVQMLFRVPLGVLSDKIRRRKPFVVLGIAASLTAAAGMLLFPTPMGLLFFRAFAGVAAAAWVTITVLFSSYFSAEDAPRAIGRLNGFNTLGSMTASVIGAQMAERLGEPSAFWLAIGLGVAGLIVSFFLKENRPANAQPIAVKELLKVGLTPTLLSVSIIAVVLNTIFMGTSGSFLQPYARSIGATTGQLGFLTIATNAPFVVASMLGGTLLIKRMTPRQIIIAGAVMMTIAILLVPLTDNFYSLAAVQVLQGLGNGLINPMLMSLAILAIVPEKRGVAMGFFQSIYALGIFAGPVLSGAISQNAGLQISYFVMAALAAGMSLLAVVLLKRRT